MTTEERYSIVLKELAARLPDAESELQFRNPFELIVAVVLSAQCTDKRVNKNTPALFAAYPDAEAMSRATERACPDACGEVWRGSAADHGGADPTARSGT